MIPLKNRHLEQVDSTVGWDIVLPRLENGQFKDQQIDDWIRGGPDEDFTKELVWGDERFDPCKMRLVGQLTVGKESPKGKTSQ